MTNLLTNGQNMCAEVVTSYESLYPMAVCKIIDYITILVSDTVNINIGKQQQFLLLKKIYDNEIGNFELLMDNLNTPIKGNAIPIVETEIQKLVNKKNVA